MSDTFTTKIKSWIELDNKQKSINNELKNIRDQKKILNTDIIRYVENNNLNNTRVQISDGLLRFLPTKVTPPLTFKIVEECLLNIIDDKEKVKEIILYIKEQRDVKSYTDIKRYYNN